MDNKNLEMKSSREAFGDAIVDLAEQNESVVVVNADLPSSLRLEKFIEKFPERYFQVGVAEQSMAGVGTGLALYGKTPFITSFAAFSPGLNWSQIRLAAMSQANLKIVSSHYGLNVGEDGASAQMLEDIALMRVIPGMAVLSPGDYTQTVQLMKQMVDYHGPVYMRVTREKFPVIFDDNDVSEIGKPQVIQTGNDLTVVVTGSMLYESIKTVEMLKEKGISAELINLHTIKPIEPDKIISSLEKTKILVTIEEHEIAGGMGSAVVESLGNSMGDLNFKWLALGVDDKFGTSGKGIEVMKAYGLDRENFTNKISKFISAR